MRKLLWGLLSSFVLVVVWTSSLAFAESFNPRQTPAVKVVRENSDAVVNISTEHILLLRENPYWGSYGNEFDFFFGQFFGLQSPQRAVKLKSVGSGVIVNEDGLVVTNAHVVHMASTIFVILKDGMSVKGTVVYESLKDDLALVKIDPPRKLQAVTLGTTDDIMIGETAIAIGNPLGLENTVTSGIISGKNREVLSSQGLSVAQGLIQTDAPINPGNSGGALLNLNGELIGINVAVVQNSQSIGFAVPVERVKDAIQSHARNQAVSIRQKGMGKRGEPSERSKKFSPPGPGDSWDPFGEMTRMTQEMDRMFQNIFDRGFGGQDQGTFSSDIFYDPSLTVEDQGETYVVNVEVQGLNKEKMNIDIHEGVITVSGEYSAAETQEGPQGYFSSSRVGSFVRTVPLPDDADTEKVKTETQGDVIMITIPKKK